MGAGNDILFGFVEAGITAQVLATIPEFFWELSLGICLLLKALGPATLAAQDEAQGVIALNI